MADAERGFPDERSFRDVREHRPVTEPRASRSPALTRVGSQPSTLVTSTDSSIGNEWRRLPSPGICCVCVSDRSFDLTFSSTVEQCRTLTTDSVTRIVAIDTESPTQQATTTLMLF
ncbi:hypothetical protein J6590_079570 [Homalodisca vitripennis]|nr:hypothetical protein J6590_079570 [Homalodisca vitripennis]